MKYISTFLLMIFITGCITSPITEEDILGYKESCEKQFITVVESERAMSIKSCVKDRIKVEHKYMRNVRSIEFIEEYYRQVAACDDSGGHMIIQRRTNVGRYHANKPPMLGDAYGCLSSYEFNRWVRDLQRQLN